MFTPLSALMDERSFAGAAWMGQRYISLGQDHPDTWLKTVTALRRLNRFDEAFDYCERAIQQHSTHSGLRLKLAELTAACGNLTKAEELYRDLSVRDVSFSPSVADALVDISHVGLDDPLVSTLRDMADSRSSHERSRANFSLGKILVRRGEHGPGFDHYALGNKLKLGELGDGPSDFAFGFKPGRFDREAFPGPDNAFYRRDRPPAVIIGGLPRSGKSLTESLLCRIDGVAAGGELGFLGSCASLLTTHSPLELSSLLRVRFSDHLLGMGLDVGSTLVDTMPSNLKNAWALALLFPEAPVVLCRRSLLSHGLSLFFKNFKKGHDYSYDLRTIGKAIARSECLIDYWRTILPNRTIVIDYEDLVANPAGTLRRLTAELELPLVHNSEASTAEDNVFRFPPGSSHLELRPDAGVMPGPFLTRIEPMKDAYFSERARLVFSPLGDASP